MKIDFSIEISDDQIELIKQLMEYEKSDVDFKPPTHIIDKFGHEKIILLSKVVLIGSNKKQTYNIVDFDFDHANELWVTFIGGIIYDQVANS